MSLEIDPRLQGALRHAPDHDAPVPPTVREAILSQARAAVRKAPVPEQKPWWRGLADAWLRPARLGYSGAFVVLLVLGVWGLERIDVESRRAPGHDEPVPAAPAPAPADVQEAAAGTQAARAGRQERAAGADKAAPTPANQVQSPSVPPAAAPRAAAPIAEAPRRPQAADPPAQAPTAESRVVEAAAPSAAPPSPRSPAMTSRAAPMADEGSAADAARAAARARTGADADMQAGALGKAMPQQGAAAAAPSGLAREASLADPVAALAERARSEPTWRWDSAGYRGPHGPAQAVWLDILRDATNGKWQRVDTLPEGALLRLVDGSGRAVAIMVVTAEPAAWLKTGAMTLRAPLSDAAAATLRTQQSGW